MDCDCELIVGLINAKIQQLLENNQINTATQPSFTYYCDEPVNDQLAMNLKASLETGFGGPQYLSIACIIIDCRHEDAYHFSQEQAQHHGNHGAYVVTAQGDVTSIYLGKFKLPDGTFVTVGTRFTLLTTTHSV